jgi:hypothetical protein
LKLKHWLSFVNTKTLKNYTSILTRDNCERKKYLQLWRYF